MTDFTPHADTATLTNTGLGRTDASGGCCLSDYSSAWTTLIANRTWFYPTHGSIAAGEPSSTLLRLATSGFRRIRKLPKLRF